MSDYREVPCNDDGVRLDNQRDEATTKKISLCVCCLVRVENSRPT